jgi:putative hydrolase of the HAD superfamily
MIIKLKQNNYFVFDLDDTLFSEIDFLKSAYKHIAQKIAPSSSQDLYQEMYNWFKKGKNVFSLLRERYEQMGISDIWLLKEYREHLPEIQLLDGVEAFLQELKLRKIEMGLLTDGRSLTQRNKLKALHLTGFFSDIIISEEFGSEKPASRNYTYFSNKYPDKEFYFVGDNTSKDFKVPAELGWTTICIKDAGNNIHSQDITQHPKPDMIISSLSEIKLD